MSIKTRFSLREKQLLVFEVKVVYSIMSLNNVKIRKNIIINRSIIEPVEEFIESSSAKRIDNY